MIFTPFVIFGHTWEFDENTNVIDALIDRRTFFKYFHIEYDDAHTTKSELISVSIHINSYYPKQLKVVYELFLFSGETLIFVDKAHSISIPNIDEEYVAKHLFNWMVNNSAKRDEIKELISMREYIYTQQRNQYSQRRY